MQRGILLVVAALCGCKSPGTITLEFDLDGSACPAFGSDYWTTGAGSAARCDDMSIKFAHYVLYAERDASCSTSACGVREGTKVIGVCPDPSSGAPCVTVDDVRARELNLPPGLWAVVLEVWANGSTKPCLVANECIEITVDGDGVASRDAGPAEMGGCSVCAM